MKKTITFLAFIFFLYSSNLFAQYGWQGVSGGGSHLTSTHYTSSSVGYAVGYGGTIIKTVDGGLNWTNYSNSGTTNNLFSVYFASSTHGWTVGSSGTIKATTNGGSTWVTQTSGTGLNFNAVYFTSTTHGCAVGANGTIKVTTDGGATWTTKSSGTTAWLLSVYFASSTQGWAVGNGGTVLTTNDGGNSWTPQTSGASYGLNSVYFTNATNGFITSSLGLIYVTTNGGNTWVEQQTPTLSKLNSVHFASTTDGWIVGDNGIILITSDGGTSWSIQPSGTTNSLNSIFMTSSTSGTSVGINGTVKIYKCLTTAPTADTLQGFCSTQNPTVADIVATGNSIQWYSTPSGGSPLLSTDALINNNYYYASQTNGGCESTSRASVRASISSTVPAQPSFIGNSTVCEGSSQTYIANTNKATSFTWSLPAGWSGSSTTASINTIPNNSSGIITVTANNACGSSSPNTFSVVVNPLPLQPSSINGSVTVCDGSSQAYSVFSEAGVTYNWIFPVGWNQVAGGTTNSAEAIVGSTGGDIVVTPSNSCGDGSSRILSVTVNPMPDVTVNLSGNTLTANQNGAINYQWLDCNSSFDSIVGETNQSFSPTLSGSYAVVVDLNGCISQSVCEVVTITSIDENKSSLGISIYPNPNNGTFNLKAEKQLGKVEVLNVFGQVVFLENNTTLNQVQISLNDATGIYFVRLTDENNMVYQIEKIIKQ